MDKNSKKIISTIVSKTLVFIFVVLFVIAFKYIFGSPNLFIGVTTIVLTLALLEQNLTEDFSKNLVQLIIFNLVLGLGSFIAYANIWAGILVNFAIMFLIGYIFSYELKKSINMLVGLHYILMMTSPITLEQLPMRLISLVCGACIIMLAQLIINKNKLQKIASKMLDNIGDCISKKFDLVIQGKDLSEINSIIDKDINKLKIIIVDGSEKKVSLTNYAKSIINILSCLEKINILLDTIYIKEIDKDILRDICKQLINVKNKRFNKASLEARVNKYKDDTEKFTLIYEFITTLEILDDQVNKIKSLKEYDIDLKTTNLENFTNININKRNIINIKSNRVAYGIRLGLLVTITTFITNYFSLQFGNWMVYTVFALTQPYAEFTRVKSKKRIVGTIIGALIIFVLFNIVKEPEIRTLILLAAGYLMGYVSEYRNTVIFVTINSIASASINLPNPNYIIVNRLMFVIIGIAISLIANKLIFHRRYNDEEVKLQNIQKQISDRIVKEVLETEGYNLNGIGRLYLMQAMIENRIETLNLNIEKEILYKNKKILNDIHQIYLAGYELYDELINEVKRIIINSSSRDKALSNLIIYIEEKEDMIEKTLLTTINKTYMLTS